MENSLPMKKLADFLLVLLAFVPLAAAQEQTPKGNTMHHAMGTFDVKMKPEPLSDVAAKTQIGRMSIDKVFHGQLEGASQGEFLSAGSPDGSGAYVAVERVTGTLDGKAGSFVFVHRGLMTRGTPEMTVTVVPDSGTGELKGLTGTFTVTITAGKHTYDFAYSL